MPHASQSSRNRPRRLLRQDALRDTVTHPEHCFAEAVSQTLSHEGNSIDSFRFEAKGIVAQVPPIDTQGACQATPTCNKANCHWTR